MSASTDAQAPVSIWNPRYKRNVWLYVIIYAFLGFTAGITNDALYAYINITSPHVYNSISTWQGIGTLIMTVLILYIHKVGYKKMLVLVGALSAVSLFVFMATNNFWAVGIVYAVMYCSVAAYDYIFPLMYAVYTPRKTRTWWMTVVMVVNLITQTLMTFFDGKIVVYAFSKFQGISYAKASELSVDESKLMSTPMAGNYLAGYKVVIWIALICAAIGCVLAFFLKEEKSDYQETAEELAERHATKGKLSIKPLFNKYVITFVVYTALNAFGAALVIPYFPTFFNTYLHIQRNQVSTIMSLSNFGMLAGFFLAAWLEDKFGSVISIAGAGILCIPIMLVIPFMNGIVAATGLSMVATMSVIIVLRSGIANMTNPTQNSFQMYLVPKDYRPAFTSMMTLLMAILNILEGIWTDKVLFASGSGYQYGYYIASASYLAASILLIAVCTKKYNRISQQKISEEEEAQNADQSDEKAADAPAAVEA